MKHLRITKSVSRTKKLRIGARTQKKVATTDKKSNVSEDYVALHLAGETVYGKVLETTRTGKAVADGEELPALSDDPVVKIQLLLFKDDDDSEDEKGYDEFGFKATEQEVLAYESEVTFIDREELGVVEHEEKQISLRPTAVMALEAEEGLSWAQVTGKGNSQATMRIGSQIKARENLTPSTVDRMIKFFEANAEKTLALGFRRGEQDFPTATRVEWAMRGGDSGHRWARSKMALLSRRKLIQITQEEQSGGKAVMFDIETPEGSHARMAGVVVSKGSSLAKIALGVPGPDGVLVVDGSAIIEVPLGDLRDVDLETVKRRVAGWESFSKGLEHNCKQVAIRDADKNIVDYKGVTINGYLSTFEHVTTSDRDGDYVKQGAFEDTINRFMKNPVMLLDHTNHTSSIAGSFTSVVEDRNGLKIAGKVSDAPGLKDIRFKVAEGHLKTLSMGGLFLYLADGKGIENVELWEGSMVPIPSNPDALFSTRGLDVDLASKAMKKHVAREGEWRMK